MFLIGLIEEINAWNGERFNNYLPVVLHGSLRMFVWSMLGVGLDTRMLEKRKPFLAGASAFVKKNPLNQMSAEVRIPPEFKHITKGRKRN